MLRHNLPIRLAACLSFALSRFLFAASPPPSTFFSSAAEESFSTYQMNGDGDLWPSCWADDGNLYAANGDGNAFAHSGLRFDMALSRISGMPPRLVGETIATNIGTNWSGHDYNRKPTGMLCVNHVLYLAFQNLNLKNFNDAPAASIARSTDHGVTWSWNRDAPMFGDPANPQSPLAYRFTTIFFLDFGQDSVYAPHKYVYAYGLDRNWRGQTALYLARIPKSNIQIRSAWQFFTGLDTAGNPIWSGDITVKKPVLTDDRSLYAKLATKEGCPANQSVISQGGVVYDAPLRRYLFASWSCATHELYEAPQPWGPWKLFLSKDFGPLHLPENRGEYGTNIPSKFISSDGKVLYLQSNVCCGGNSYTYALRKLYLQSFEASEPKNQPSGENLAVTGAGVTAISKSTRQGRLCGIDCFNILNSGNVNATEDDNDGEEKDTDWWGYTWSQSYRLNRLVYVAGVVSKDGGWFRSNFRVQVRQHFRWIDVKDLSVNPPYPVDQPFPSHTVFDIRFATTWGDGVRIIGTPGGPSYFTSIAQLAAYLDPGDLVSDGGFEFQLGPVLSGFWAGEGPDPKGITRFEQSGHSGVNNAWLVSGAGNWNAIVQTVHAEPHTAYVLSAWVRSDLTASSGRLGVRTPGEHSPIGETSFGAATGYTQIEMHFNSGTKTSLEIYIGLTGQTKNARLMVDDISLRKN